MRKNGVKYISLQQYRATDTFIFALILGVSEALVFFAGKWFPQGALFTFSLMVPIVLTVMMRWGWVGALYAAAGGLLWCLLSIAGGVQPWQWLVYIIGNSFIALMLLPIYLIGKEKISKRWWACALLAVGGWLCVYLGRATVWAISFAVSPVSGVTAGSGFLAFAASDLLSLPVAVVVVLVLRKLDGMFEDQTAYLKQLGNENRKKVNYDGSEELEELDEEALSILNKDNDLY